jgi:uncharacterized protein DUF998
MKKLLYAGVAGPILFILVFLIEGATRPGYSVWRNFVSQLATGPGGWVQVINFLMCGSLVVLFAIGLRMTIRGTRGSIGLPLLLGLFGVDLMVAGLFSTDPALGYPPGAAQVHTAHGMVHGFAGLGAFTLLPAAAFVASWHFAADRGERSWFVYSLVVGVVLMTGFIVFTAISAMDSAGTWHNAPTGIAQRAVIITGWTWIASVAWHHMRMVSAANDRGSAAPPSRKPRQAEA